VLNYSDYFKIILLQVFKFDFSLKNFLLCLEDPGNRARLLECLEGILNRAQDAPKSKKVQHANAKNAVLFEAIALIIHHDSEPNLLVRACNQLGTFLSHRETNLRFKKFLKRSTLYI